MLREFDLYEVRRKNVKVTCIGGQVIKGYCSEFTKALDNEPEEASIILDNGVGGLTEIYQHEIKNIEEVK